MSTSSKLLTLTTGVPIDAAVAFSFVRALRALLERDRRAFSALRAIATGQPQVAGDAEIQRLKDQGFLHNSDGEIPHDLKQVIDAAVKDLDGGKVIVGFPFDRSNRELVALWAEQNFNQWQTLGRLRKQAGPDIDPGRSV